jgi:hypothetical protein
MADLTSILTDPNYVNANAATKAAIFDKFSAQDKNYTGANSATQAAIRTKFGLAGTATPEEDGVLQSLKTAMSDSGQNLGNLAAGAVRGAGSIGATLVAPYDMAKDALAGKGLSLESNRQRRADMDAALTTMGAQPDSMMYQGGKLAGEIAGTAGTGGLLANGARAVGAAPTIANALASGGLGGAGNFLTRVGAGAVTGGATAGLIDPSQAGTGAAIGAAFPGAVGIGGLAKKAIGTMKPEVIALATRAKQLGIDIPADRLVNSKPVNAMAASLSYIPLSGRQATETKMGEQLDRALSRTFGGDSSNVTMALRNADDILGAKFDAALKNNPVKFDQQLLEEGAASANLAIDELGDAAAPILKQLDAMVKAAGNGTIDGQAAYNIKKALDRIGNRTSPEGFYARDLKKVLMGALERSMGTEKAAAFATTRKQYGNMLALDKIAQNGGEGGVSVNSIANMKNIGNPDLQELADIAAQFVKPRESSHGAMQRVMMGSAGAGAALFTNPLAAAGALASARGTNMLLNSTALRNSLMGQTNPVLQSATSWAPRIAIPAAVNQ